jgi:hypothetical protein
MGIGLGTGQLAAWAADCPLAPRSLSSENFSYVMARSAILNVGSKERHYLFIKRDWNVRESGVTMR